VRSGSARVGVALVLVTACARAPAPVARSGPARANEEAPAPISAPRSAAGGTPVPARLGGDALHADVLVLRRAYEALHPGLYRYATRAEMDAAFDALDATLAGGATLAEAYRAFAIFAAKVRCGHTFLNPTNQRKAVQEELFDRPARLPFHFRWLDGRMIVTTALARDVVLAPGTEVVAIDGAASSVILSRLLTVSRADGANDAKRVANLERLGHDRYEAFDIAFSLFFPKADDTFALDVVDPDGTRRSLVARGVRGAAESGGDAGRADDAAKDAPLWSLRYLDARTGYLAMPTWVTYATRWDWKEDLRRTFVDLAAKKATALVVDLRGNEGGEDVGNVILGHLLDRPLRTEGLVRWTRYRSVPDDLRASLHTLDKTFFDWGDAATPRGDGFYRLTRFDDEPGGDVLAPIAPRARLELVVLVDGSNSSAPSSSARSCRSTAWGGSSASPRAATSGASTAVPSSSWSSRPAGSSSISPSSRASRRTDAPMRFRTRGSSPTSSRGRPRRTSPRVVTWRSRRRAGSRRSDGLQLTASRAASAAPARVRVASPRMACSTSASIVPSRTFRHMTKSARSE
jgi:hypothetical protein